MTEQEWRRRTWWLKRYFELAVPMAFTLYVGFNVTLALQEKMSLWAVLEMLIGLIYMTAVREIVEATWRWQALDWLTGMRYRLTCDEAKELESQAENPEMKVCRVWVVMLATVITVLAFSQTTIWAVMARIVIATVVGTLMLTHILMFRLQLRDEAERL